MNENYKPNDFDLNDLDKVDYIVHQTEFKKSIFCFKQDDKYIKQYSNQNFYNVQNEINKNTNLSFKEIIILRGYGDHAMALINNNNVLNNTNHVYLHDGTSALQIVFKSLARIYIDLNFLTNR